MVSLPADADLFAFDADYCGGGELAGADEAGRGCLAGPLVAAAVVFDYSRGPGAFAALARLNDSKKLSRARREELFPLIVGAASRFTIVMAASHTIDDRGLHRTNLALLARSLTSLDPCPPLALVDGYQLPAGPPHRALKHGDATSACVAAASVLAKVSRDRLMMQLHQRFPQYGFNRHVGYATRDHRQAIAEHGLSSLHRRSFRISLPLFEGDGT